MNQIEEQLWNFIDGNLSAEESQVIADKIAADPDFQSVYKELLFIHRQLNELETDEPSLSFNRKVMDQIELLPPPVALTTKINKWIVYTIGSFFLLAILGIFTYAVSISKITFSMPAINLNTISNKLTDPAFLTGFILIDVASALLYLDSLLRRRKMEGK